MTDETLLAAQTRRLLHLCRARRWRVATAESCTGGAIAAALTDIAGSSDVFERGYVTYSNAAKAEMLAVDPALIEKDGAVSEAVAAAMAEGALEGAGVDLAVSVTGIAGPGGGSAEKPVGLVYFGLAVRGRKTEVTRKLFEDEGRAAIRAASVACALELLTTAADDHPAPS